MHSASNQKWIWNPITLDTSSSPQRVPIRVKLKSPSLMRRICILIVAVALSAGLLSPTSMAQPPGHLERKVVSKIAPFYPEIAKRNRITGVVKLEVVVRKNGSVQSTKVLGGSPVLIGSATDAVLKWRFDPAPEESTEVVQLAFEN
jgi:TonB family protein